MASKRKNNGANVRRELSKILQHERLSVDQYFRRAAADYAASESDISICISVSVYTKGGALPSYVMLAIDADRVAPRVRYHAKSRDLHDARHV